jgi:hypothetical protein
MISAAAVCRFGDAALKSGRLDLIAAGRQPPLRPPSPPFAQLNVPFYSARPCLDTCAPTLPPFQIFWGSKIGIHFPAVSSGNAAGITMDDAACRRTNRTPHYSEPPPRYYEPPGPQLRLDLGGRDEARYSPPNPAFKTWNNCPPNFTVQDGLCKPYTGR